MSMKYDLHMHSTVSDGTLSVDDLVSEVAKAGVDCMALTDHDTVDGIEAALQACDDKAIQCIPGVEISITWNGQVIHILGLNINHNNNKLKHGLNKLLEFRKWRAEAIANKLGKAGIPDALAGAARYAKGSLIGRMHFARFLVEQGICADIRSVFKKYLVRGKPGHVTGEWASLEDALSWIRDAGGIAAIAHPARYRLTATRLRALIEDFSEAGGSAYEVVSGSHNDNEIRSMAGYCDKYQLYATAGSDYHGPENQWLHLGRLPTIPEPLVPVWQHPDWPAPLAS